MGSSAAILRRWISSSGMLRSRRISVEGANSGYFFYFSSSCCRESDANRMMSTAMSGGVSSPSAPLLILPPAVDGSGNIAYKFHCLAKKEEFIHTSNIVKDVKDVEFVGSSHGWLALYNRQNSDLFLSNPITDRHIKLPSLLTLGAADRLILSSSLSSDGREGGEEEDEPLAFTTFGSHRGLAFCSLCRLSKEWTLFGGNHAYDNLVYSTRHKRLFCVCQENHKRVISLEGWNVDQHQPPTLDWVIRDKKGLNFDSYYHRWPRRSEFKKKCLQMNYLVCAEHSGELFLVVRHVNPRAGPFGSMLNKVMISRLRGCDYIKTPYKTIDFDVYKIDFDRGAVINMEDSLEGLAMFVGINHPFAISAAEIAGVKPDSVYFTDENRLVHPTRLERTTYGGHDNGIFDYQNKEFYSCNDIYPVEYEKIRKILPLPLWFTPTTIINSK